MNLKELASLLNLSTTTVSRALNGYPEVNAETRERVVAAARRHGYAPNQGARRLATGRAHAIGHVIPLARHQMINPIFAEFISGAGETYSIAGYDMIASVVPEADEADAYRAMIAQRKVDGILVHTPRLLDPRIDLLSGFSLPFLMHGRDSRPERDYCWIDINNRRAFLRATDLLLDLGHRRIGFLNGMEHLNFAQRRRSGYCAALTARDIAPDPDLMRHAEMTEAYGYDGVREMLGLPDPPTAFLASSIITAFGALRAVSEAGLRLGADISIVTHDDELSHMSNAGPVPLFTATRSSIRAAGRRAAEMLIALIEQPGAATRSELWEADLTIGRSTGPRV
ncbi:substrate-binding domain-containing protein [Amaricoccus solimangrovi]|uniref:LacI family transcriptional regulator n=1 Tax=Amaricoccus solimangrovi TaxID=2589815 RepID=A0A501WVC2_9RHOB|nr:substrate-binding domain-containing protein [Amaricoccus solimangrovi]TPE52255.1 LacI family transcriptional regulator [Amaricoccus solimangrovi]